MQGKKTTRASDYMRKKFCLGIEEYCFLHLRTREGIPLQDFEERYGFPIEHWFGREIAMLKERKLLKESLGHLFMTYHGAALGNFVFEQFIIDE